MSSGLGRQTRPTTGWTVKTVAVPSSFAQLRLPGIAAVERRPGVDRLEQRAPLPDGVVRCQRMKSWVRSRGAKPGGAWLCIAALVVITQSKRVHRPTGGRLSQSNLAFRSVAR